MSPAQLAARLYLEPWCIHPGHHVAFGAALSRGDALAQPLQRADDPAGPTFYGMPLAPQTKVFGRTAVIPVHGVTGRHLNPWELLFYGGCDYSILDLQLHNAATDDAIDTIVIDFRSPGGMANGLEETADRIRAITGKRKVAYSSAQICSAAYALGAQCDAMFAAGSAMVGSLGTILAVLDSSRFAEMAGLKLEVFRSGDLKSAPQPGEPLTDEVRAFYQQRLDEHHSRFLALLSHRPQVDVAALRGAWMTARSGLDVGLVDALVPSLPDLLEMLASE